MNKKIILSTIIYIALMIRGDLASDKPTGDLASDKPTGDLASDKPTGDLASDKPTGDLASDKPTGDLASDKPTGDLASDKPTDDKSLKEQYYEAYSTLAKELRSLVDLMGEAEFQRILLLTTLPKDEQINMIIQAMDKDSTNCS
uniref:Polymorphic mucin truncated splice variant C1/2/7r2.1 n=1 Tax=Schistosoma mansoni TaxID=6183 RepID=B3V407_SCHMA|nr:polymorphic mucin truncated splice variant C1/2/7r2.1 [Schistosoma mansoni]